MKIYFDGIQLIGLIIMAVSGLFLLGLKLLDRWCNNHYGHPIQRWLYKKLFNRDY